MPAGKIPEQEAGNPWICNGLPCKFKIERDAAGPAVLFSFAHTTKFSPAIGRGKMADHRVNKFEQRPENEVVGATGFESQLL